VSRRGGVGFVIFLLLLVCVLAVVFVVIYIAGNEEPVRPEGLNASLNVSLLNVSVGSNALSKVGFVLRNETHVFVKGDLFAFALEFFRGGVSNQSFVWLSASSSEYYWNESVCNISYNNFPCRVGLKKKALGYQVFFNGSVLVIDTNESGAVLQAPILFCVTEQANVINVLMDLSTVPVPSDLRKGVDFCYKFEYDIRGRVLFGVDVHKNPFLNDTRVLVFTIRDFEKNGFFNVGDRSVGCLV
jgi:hypothetical protein